ncbi:MAG: alginate export family protein, partial [Armatimonadota bacterium]
KHSQTLAGFYPTTGAFNMDGGDSISKVRQLYVADASSTATSSNRYFVGHYVDARGITPVDNSAIPNSGAIEITTLGGHALSAKTYGKSRVDTFLWGGTQTGNWGAQVHQAYAAAAEIGFKSPETKGWWLRGGAGYFSGDANPNDAKHQSWAPQTYAPRLLFRTPVVTESNLQDFYAMAVKRNKRESIRLEAHAYRVDKPADRWYLGGPVFQSGGAFGLNGKPTAGMRDIASAVDISYDVTLNQRDTLNVYAGYVHGGAVAATSYSSRSAFLGFAQLVRKF